MLDALSTTTTKRGYWRVKIYTTIVINFFCFSTFYSKNHLLFFFWFSLKVARARTYTHALFLVARVLCTYTFQTKHCVCKSSKIVHVKNWTKLRIKVVLNYVSFRSVVYVVQLFIVYDMMTFTIIRHIHLASWLADWLVGKQAGSCVRMFIVYISASDDGLVDFHFLFFFSSSISFRFSFLNTIRANLIVFKRLHSSPPSIPSTVCSFVAISILLLLLLLIILFTLCSSSHDCLSIRSFVRSFFSILLISGKVYFCMV